jgi:4-amino-4-deoxy-L-arabinose transferase-like glycosyltransferase
MTPTELPRGLLACIPMLWSRVLFPGRLVASGGSSRRSWLILLALPGLLLYPCLSFRLLEPDEGRYAEIPREMLARGEWVVPTLQGLPYLDKPPLLYWLVMLSYSVFGVHDWAARLVPALAVHLTVLVVYGVGRRSLGERPAFWGALLLALAPGFTSVGRLLVLDGLLTCCVTVSILAAFEAIRGDRLKWGWWLTAALACGLGVLTKGPVAVVLLAGPLAMFGWLSGRGLTCGVRPKAVAAFIGVLLAVNLPWYAAVATSRPEFGGYFFWQHNVMRFLSPFDHIQPFWYYVPILLGGLLPATVLLIAFVRFLLNGDECVAAKRCPELGYFLLAGGWCVLFFSLSGSKLPTYVMPAFPPLALAVGYFVANSKWDRSRLTSAGVMTATVLLAAAHFWAIPWYAKTRSPMGRPELVAEYLDDPDQAVLCYPRSCDSVAFYLGRDDLRNVRSKEAQALVESLLERPRTVVLFTHRHSLDALRYVLPPALEVTRVTSMRRGVPGGALAEKLAGDTPWGLCDVAVIERRR